MTCFLQSRNYALAGSFLPTFASMNRIFTSNSGSHSTLANHPDFHFHIFIDFSFSYFSCIFSTYWTLMLWYFKHIYFQKLLIYVKVRDTNLAICFFFRLMDFSYEIVMAIYIEEVIRGQELFSLKIYAAWQLLNVNVQDAELIFKNISSKTRFGVSQLLRWPKMFFFLQSVK